MNRTLSLLAVVLVCASPMGTILQAQPAKAGVKKQENTTPGPWADPNTSGAAGMKYHTFRSTLAKTDASYVVYLPPNYEAEPGQRYPVVYWLHGRGGNQDGAAVFATRLDAAIKAGKAPAMIVVGVNGLKYSSWVDSFDGRFPVESVLVKELIPHIDATFRTLRGREQRAIEGFSMGGAGAAKIGFKHIELFGAVSILAGALHDFESYAGRGTAFADIYGGNKDYFEANNPWRLVEQNAARIRERTHVRIAVGGNDGLKERNTSYHDTLTRLKIDHSFDIVPNAAHNPAQVYDGLGDKTWEFYRVVFPRRGP